VSCHLHKSKLLHCGEDLVAGVAGSLLEYKQHLAATNKEAGVSTYYSENYVLPTTNEPGRKAKPLIGFLSPKLQENVCGL
jgi:hypothetical protein